MNDKFDKKKAIEARVRMEQKIADQTGTTVEAVRADLAVGVSEPMSQDVKTEPSNFKIDPDVEATEAEATDFDKLAEEAAKEEGELDLSTLENISIPQNTVTMTAPKPDPIAAATPKEAEPTPAESVTLTEEDKKDAADVPIDPPATIVSKKDTARDFLDNFTVDLNSFDVVDATVIDQVAYTNIALQSDASYQVICLRSGYSSSMMSLNFKDKDKIRNSNLDAFNERKQIYAIIHSKMTNSSVGQMSFAEYLKVTAYADFDTLMFGVFCQTYPGNTDFTINCGNCSYPINMQINPQAFIEIKDKAIFDYVDKVLSSQHKPMELLGNSLVHTTHRIFLPKSKIIIFIRTPSLQDHLDLLSHYNAAKMKDLRETIGIMNYIDKLFIPNIKVSKATGKPTFTEIKEFGRKLDIIYRLKDGDDDFLNGEINKREEKHNVSYRLKEFECPECKHAIKEMDIDIERLLFYQMEETRKSSMSDKETT